MVRRKRCNKCNQLFDAEQDRDLYEDYICRDPRIMRGFPDYDDDYCFNCNVNNYEDCVDQLLRMREEEVDD